MRILTVTNISSKIKQLLLIAAFLLISAPIFAQQSVYVFGVVKNTDTRKKMEGVTVELVKDGVPVDSYITSISGKFEFDLDFGFKYDIKFSMQGYVTKFLTFNTTSVPEESRNQVIPFSFEMSLFEELEGVNVDILKKPIGIILYDADVDNFNYDVEYTQSIHEAVDQLRREIEAKKQAESVAKKEGERQAEKDKIEQERLAEEKRRQEEERELLEKKFEGLLAEADNSFAKKDYKKSIDKYENALLLFSDDPRAIAGLEKSKKAFKIEEDAKNLEKEFSDIIASADGQFIAQDFQGALATYQQAKSLKPADSYVLGRISEIQKILEEMARVAEEERQQLVLKAQYDKLVASADDLFSKTDYKNAITKYQEAAKTIPSESYPAEQITEANKRIVAAEKLAEEKRNAEELAANYAAAIKEADGFFAETKYEQAIASYNKALTIKSSELYPKEKIELANKAIIEKAKKEEEEKKSKALEAEYVAAITNADKLFGTAKYDEAIVDYKKALGLKPNDTYASGKLKQIEEIKTQLAAEAAKIEEEERLAKELEANYKSAITSADSKFNAKDYQGSIVAYNNALNLKPLEPYPASKIKDAQNQIKVIEEKAKKEAELKAKYEDALKLADAYFVQNQWTEAITAYNNVLLIKPNDSYTSQQIKKSNEAIAAAEAQRKLEEEARLAAEKAANEEAARLAAEAEAKKQAELAAQQEAARLAAEEAARKKAAEEAQRKLEEEARLATEKAANQEAARLAAEAEAKKQAELAAQQEAERLAAEEVARKKAAEEAQRKLDEEARLKAENEADQEAARIAAEAEAKRKADFVAQQEAERLAAEEAARKKAAEEAQRKLDEEARLKAENEANQAAAKIAAEAEAKRKADFVAQQEAERLAAEALARKKAAAEAQRKLDEEARLAAEKEASQAAAKLAADEAARRKAAEQASLLELQQAQQLKENEFNNNIKLADVAFENKNFQEAITYYEKALELRIGADYPQRRIDEAKSALSALEAVVRRKLEEQQNQANQEKIFEAAINAGKKEMSMANYDAAEKEFQKALKIKPENAEAKSLLNEVQTKKREFLALQAQQNNAENKAQREEQLLRERAIAAENKRKNDEQKIAQSEKVDAAKSKVINNSTISEKEIEALMNELKAQEEQEKYDVILRQKEIFQNWNNAKAQMDENELSKITLELEKLRKAERELSNREPISYAAIESLKLSLDQKNKQWKDLSDEERSQMKRQLDVQRKNAVPIDPGSQLQNSEDMVRKKADLTQQYKAYTDRSDQSRADNYELLLRKKEYVEMLYIEFKSKKSYVDELAFYKEMISLSEQKRISRFNDYQEEVMLRIDSLKALRLDENRLTTQKDINIILAQEQKDQVKAFLKMKESEQENFRLTTQADLDAFDKNRKEELLIRDSQRQDKAFQVEEQKKSLAEKNLRQSEAQLNKIQLNEGVLLQQKADSDRKTTVNKDAFEKSHDEIKQVKLNEIEKENAMQIQQGDNISKAMDSIALKKQGIVNLSEKSENINQAMVDSITNNKERLLIQNQNKQQQFDQQLKQNKIDVDNVYVPEQKTADADIVLKEKEAVGQFNEAQKEKGLQILAKNEAEIEAQKQVKSKIPSTKTIDEKKIIDGNKVVIQRTVTEGDKVDVYKMVVAKWGTFYFKNDKSITQDNWKRETQSENL